MIRAGSGESAIFEETITQAAGVEARGLCFSGVFTVECVDRVSGAAIQ